MNKLENKADPRRKPGIKSSEEEVQELFAKSKRVLSTPNIDKGKHDIIQNQHRL